MKVKSLNFIIPLVVYPFDVMVSLGESDKDVSKRLTHFVGNFESSDIEHNYSQRGRTIIYSGNQTLIRMYKLKDTPEWHGQLAHEIFHAVEFIMERIGMKLTFDSDEAYAYLIGHITTEIFKRLK